MYYMLKMYYVWVLSGCKISVLQKKNFEKKLCLL